MEVDLRVTVEWIDNRLTTNRNTSSNRDWVGIGKEIDKIWSPSLIFRNCKGCLPRTFKSNSQIPVYVQKSTGRLWTQFRALNKFSCSIDLRLYPMDIQYCPLQVYTGEDYTEALVLKHYGEEGERKTTGNLTLSEYAIPFIQTGDCTFSASSSNKYSCLELRVRFVRLLGFHMTTSYLPSMMIVALSWISFWLPVDVIPARVALGLTSLLTLAIRLDQAQRNLPPVSYAKAIDVWMLACILIVSLSLLEFAICNYLSRTRKITGDLVKPLVSSRPRSPFLKKGNSFSAQSRRVGSSFTQDGMRMPGLSPRKKKPETSTKNGVGLRRISAEKKHVEAAQKEGSFFDRISRIVFPGIFLIFNFIYWSYYLLARQNHGKHL